MTYMIECTLPFDLFVSPSLIQRFLVSPPEQFFLTTCFLKPVLPPVSYFVASRLLSKTVNETSKCPIALTLLMLCEM